MDTLLRTRAAMTQELGTALELRDRQRIEAAALWLQATGMPAVDLYTAVLDVLLRSGLSEDYPRSAVERVEVAQVHELLRDAISRLRASRPSGIRGQAVVSQPDGPRHVLGTGALYHLVEEAGLTVVPAGSTSLDQLVDVLDGCANPTAVTISLHEPASIAACREAVAEIRARHPRLRVIIGGALAARPELLTGLGAHAVCPTLHDLVAALEQTNPLSPRERTVLACVARGMSNPGVGAELGVAAATIKTHLDRVNAKLGTSDRTAAVAVALRRGWID